VTANDHKAMQTRPGKCENHGTVDGVRKMPRLVFPFIVTGVSRLIAMTRPFRCPQCGAACQRAS
jgi:hypothetical protein